MKFGEYEAEYHVNLHGDHRWLVHFPNKWGASILCNNGFTILEGHEPDLDHFEIGLMQGVPGNSDPVYEHPMIPDILFPVRGVTREGIVEYLDKIKELTTVENPSYI